MNDREIVVKKCKWSINNGEKGPIGCAVDGINADCKLCCYSCASQEECDDTCTFIENYKEAHEGKGGSC